MRIKRPDRTGGPQQSKAQRGTRRLQWRAATQIAVAASGDGGPGAVNAKTTAGRRLASPGVNTRGPMPGAAVSASENEDARSRHDPSRLYGRQMLRSLIFGALLGSPFALVAASAPNLEVQVAAVPSPAGPGAMGSSLVTSSEGTVWLSWLEPQGTREHAMKVARFDAAQHKWSEARRVAHGANWFVNWADFPVLAAQGDKLTAVWFVNSSSGEHAYHAQTSASLDGGKSWGSPEPLTRESSSVEFVALQPLADGRLLAAWLDGRHRGGQGHGGRQALYARILGTSDRDTMVDPSVCDCCQLSLLDTRNGALLAYRGRTADEVRDMRVAEFRGGAWSEPRTLHADGWKINACPVNGPQLAGARDQSVAVWFTAAESRPSVLASRAGPANATWGVPSRIDSGRPLGRVDSVMLADGTAFFTWLEGSTDNKEGGIFARALRPDGRLSLPALLASTTTARASGFPRVALLTDGPTPRLLLSYTQDGTPRRLVTTVVDLSFDR